VLSFHILKSQYNWAPDSIETNKDDILAHATWLAILFQLLSNTWV